MMKVFTKINKISKIILFTGALLTMATIVLSLIFYMCAGRTGNYYQFMFVSSELIVLSRQIFSITAFACIIIEYASPKEPED